MKKFKSTEASFFKDLSRLQKVIKRRKKTAEDTQAIQEEYRKQIAIAFEKSGFPERTRAKFEDVYGRMLLAVGFAFERRKTPEGILDEHKRFRGFSMSRCLQYLHPYLPAYYDEMVYGVLNNLREGGVLRTNSNLYESNIKSQLLQDEDILDDYDIEKVVADEAVYAHKLCKNVKRNAKRISRFIFCHELEQVEVVNGKITLGGYCFIYDRMIKTLQAYVEQQLAEVIEVELDFPKIKFDQFYLPKRDRGMSVTERAPIVVSAKVDGKMKDVLLTTRLLEEIEQADADLFTEERKIAEEIR
jgi:hypothetical protein